MRDLLKSISILSLRNVALLIFSIVRAKLLAIYLGPNGLGVFSQAVNFHNFLWSTSAAGTNRGSTILIGNYFTDKSFTRINRILITSLLLLTIVGLMTNLGCALFAGRIAMWVFGTQKYAYVVVIVAVSSWFAVYYSLVNVLFRGLLKTSAYALSSIVSYGLTIVIVLISIHFFGLSGAVISILAGQIINLLVGYVILRRHVLTQFPEIGFFRCKPNWDSLNQIFKFIGPILILEFVMGGGNLMLRGELIRRLGEGANGFYQMVWGISLIYMTFFNDTYNSYLLPKISSNLGAPAQTVRIQNDMMRIFLLLLAPFLIVLISLREFWIPIMYSREFLTAGSLLVWQFCGDLFAAIRMSVNATLIPHRRFSFLICEEAIRWGLWIWLSLALMPKFGLVSIPFAYFITNGIQISICITYQYLTMNFRIHRENLHLIFKLLPLVALGFLSAEFIASPWWRIPAVAVLMAVMYRWLPTTIEREKAYIWVAGLLNRDGTSKI